MNETISKLIQTTKLNEQRSHRNLTIFTLKYEGPAGPDYITLRSALAAGVIEVTEVSEGGSVPELAVRNTGVKPVIILDGEEVRGAKQNRVLNATVLVAPGVTMTIPVSCVEAGRWRRESKSFVDSDQVMFAGARSGKASRVSASLRSARGYDGGQGEVWNDVSMLMCEADVVSDTSAMSDVFEGARAGLDEYLEAFPMVDGQGGLLAVVDGHAIGLDLLSRSAAYSELHEKLMRSYAMEAHLADVRKRRQAQRELPGSKVVDPMTVATAFLDSAKTCEEEVHASVGVGNDHRLEGASVVGSALVVEDCAVHIALFPRPAEPGHHGTMRSPGWRARH